MNNTISLKQISRTGNLKANLILRQRKLNLMAPFMEINSINPIMNQKDNAEELCYSSSILQRYRYDIKRQSPFKTNNPKRCPRTSNDLKKSRTTSKHAKENVEPVFKKTKTKNILRGGGPNDLKPSNGSILTEQAFSAPINC